MIPHQVAVEAAAAMGFIPWPEAHETDTDEPGPPDLWPVVSASSAARTEPDLALLDEKLPRQTLTAEAREQFWLYDDNKTGAYLPLSKKFLRFCGTFGGSSGAICCREGHDPVYFARNKDLDVENQCFVCGGDAYCDVL